MIPLQRATLLALVFASHGLGHDLSSGALLSRGIKALGGSDNLEAVHDVVYSGGGFFRSSSMAETFGLNGLDRIMAGSGRQNVSFSFDGGVLKQRIDRFHDVSPTFLFARPNLDPVDFSLVVQGGDNGFAAIVEGSDILFAPDAPPQGYKDGLLAAFLVSEAAKMSPLLLTTILSNNNHTIRKERTTDGEDHQAVYDGNLGISVLFDSTTHLPYIVRSYENHSFFGPSTNDLLIYDYVTVNNVKFPRRLKTIYNRDKVMSDYSVGDVLVNTGIPPARFDGPPGRLPAHAPRRDRLYDFAEIGEYNAIYIWGGQYTGTFANLTAIQPWKDLPGVWHLTVADAPGYRQLVLEIGNNVIVLDAPPHQSLLVMRWVRETLGKSVTHVWPTHHHHDHSYGVVDYVAAGARVIALDEAVSYYSAIPRDKFVTYSTERPLILKDRTIHASFVHMADSLHSTDYGYVHVAPRCITYNSTTLVFDADDANTAALATTEQGALNTAVDKFAADRVALTAM